MNPGKFELVDKYKNIKEIQVPKLSPVKDGESGTETIKVKDFIARAEEYIPLGYSHYFKGGKKLFKEHTKPLESELIITHKDNPKAKKAAGEMAKSNKANFSKVVVNTK